MTMVTTTALESWMNAEFAMGLGPFMIVDVPELLRMHAIAWERPTWTRMAFATTLTHASAWTTATVMASATMPTTAMAPTMVAGCAMVRDRFMTAVAQTFQRAIAIVRETSPMQKAIARIMRQTQTAMVSTIPCSKPA